MQEDQLQNSRDAYMIEVPRLVRRAFAFPRSYRDDAAIFRFEIVDRQAKNIKLISSKGARDYADKARIAIEYASFRENPFQPNTIFECRFETNQVTAVVVDQV